MTDVSGDDLDEAVCVIVEVAFETLDPPEGTLSVAGEPPERFNGWLGLMSRLAQLLEPQEELRPTEHIPL